MAELGDQTTGDGSGGLTQSGFTVGELMVAVGIIAILLTLSVPSFSEWVLTNTANLAIRQVATDLLSARTKAVSQNSNYIVTFYSPVGGPHTYEVHNDKNNNGSRDAGEDIKSVTLPSGMQFGANSVNGVDNLVIDVNGLKLGADNAVSFNDRGYASETGAVYLVPSADLTSSRNDRMRAVNIFQATGSVRIWSYRAGMANPGPWE